MKLWLYWFIVTFGPVLIVSGLLIYNAEAMSSIPLISTKENNGLQDKTASPYFLWEVNVGSRGENYSAFTLISTRVSACPSRTTYSTAVTVPVMIESSTVAVIASPMRTDISSGRCAVALADLASAYSASA